MPAPPPGSLGTPRPSRPAGGAGQVAKLIEALRKPVHAPVKSAVLGGGLPVSVALVVLSEFDRLRDRLVPDAEPIVLDGLISVGVSHGSRAVRMLHQQLLARYGAPDELQKQHDAAARHTSLSHPIGGDDGLWDYRLRLDAEGKAVLEAAIGPLSAPWHTEGLADLRSPQQRRAHALIDVARRVTAMAKAAGPHGGHSSAPHPNPADPAGAKEPSDAGSQGAPRPGADNADPESAKVPSDAAGQGSLCPDADSFDHAGADPDDADLEAEGVDPEGAAPHSSGPSGASGPAGDQSEPGMAPPDKPAGQQDGLDPRMIQAALAGMGAGGAKATLMLTMALADLRERTGAATTLGTLDAGTLLAPETTRRIACDAAVIPVVLGTAGEILDLGRAARLFTQAQARALLLRDGHCTFPGCDIPGFWTQLHHLHHWIDGGATDLDNAALLCSRHHTIVHRDRLTATVHATGVHWDTRPGSYDHASARGQPAA